MSRATSSSAGRGTDRAFITTAHRGQNIPFDPQLTTPSVGRADVWVFDADHLGATLAGRRSPSSSVHRHSARPGGLARTAPPSTPPGSRPATAPRSSTRFWPNGGSRVPPPGTNYAGHSRAAGRASSSSSTARTGSTSSDRPGIPIIQFNLPDKDVFVIDANANPPPARRGSDGLLPGRRHGSLQHGGESGSGKVYVSNTEARNNKRFEGPGYLRRTHGSRSSQRKPHHRSRYGDGVAAAPQQAHRLFDVLRGRSPNTENALSVAIPTEMAVSANGRTLYVAAMGSSKVGIYDTASWRRHVRPETADQVQRLWRRPNGPRARR